MDLDLIDRGAMACPALPTCGLAVTESERGLPDVNARLRSLLARLGFDDSDAFVVRMTGAPDQGAPAAFFLCNTQGGGVAPAVCHWLDSSPMALRFPCQALVLLFAANAARWGLSAVCQGI